VTGKQSRIVKAAYDRLLTSLMNCLATHRWYATEEYEALRAKQDAFVEARWAPHPRYDELMAALGERPEQ
jgi:hypothetical protein